MKKLAIVFLILTVSVVSVSSNKNQNNGSLLSSFTNNNVSSFSYGVSYGSSSNSGESSFASNFENNSSSREIDLSAIELIDKANLNYKNLQTGIIKCIFIENGLFDSEPYTNENNAIMCIGMCEDKYALQYCIHGGYENSTNIDVFMIDDKTYRLNNSNAWIEYDRNKAFQDVGKSINYQSNNIQDDVFTVDKTTVISSSVQKESDGSYTVTATLTAEEGAAGIKKAFLSSGMTNFEFTKSTVTVKAEIDKNFMFKTICFEYGISGIYNTISLEQNGKYYYECKKMNETVTMLNPLRNQNDLENYF